MTSRRVGGSGSIEWDERRQGWWARLPRDLGRTRIGLYPTREEAAEALALELARYVDTPPDALTLAMWGERWLDRREASGDYRDTGTERRRWADYVTGSPLGGTPVSRVRAGDVRRWLEGLHGRAASTRRNALTVVRGALRAAVEAGLLEADPSRDVRLPRASRHGERDRWTWLDADELAALLAVSLPGRTPPERWRSIWTVGSHSGLRPGELWALEWEDVDTVRGVICVRRAVGEKGKIGPPKGGQAREVPLLAPARDALAAWAAVAKRSPRGLVWPSGQGGGHHRRGYRARFGSGLRAAGITRHVRFYDLRHTAASHLLQGTWAPSLIGRALRLEEVRDWLGHSDISVTQRYAHLAPGALRELVPHARPTNVVDLRSRAGNLLAGSGFPKPEIAGSNPAGDAEIVGLSWGTLLEHRDRLLAAGRAIADGDEHREHRCLDAIEHGLAMCRALGPPRQHRGYPVSRVVVIVSCSDYGRAHEWLVVDHLVHYPSSPTTTGGSIAKRERRCLVCGRTERIGDVYGAAR